MIELTLQSEKFRATGNLASKGVLNNLGRPSLDLLTVLVRETVQNSWDAREGAGPVRYHLALEAVDSRRMKVLRDAVFPKVPQKLPLRAWLDGEPEAGGAYVLFISDRGTSGLGGPTRADQSHLGEQESGDFVNFLRNVGAPPDKPLGGGTYGFGKAAVYQASFARTILVYTRCKSRRRDESRFIAAALGDDYMVSRGATAGRYTGRHWWGVPDDDDVVDPARGVEADQLARALRMPGFEAGERGTTIAVLGPLLGELRKRASLPRSSSRVTLRSIR